MTINEGICTNNFDLIKTGSVAINRHPPLSDESRSMVPKKLGDLKPAFRSFDHIVHSRADSLREAAAQSDMNRVIDNYRIIQQGCVSCHVAFHEEIRHERFQSELQNKE